MPTDPAANFPSTFGARSRPGESGLPLSGGAGRRGLMAAARARPGRTVGFLTGCWLPLYCVADFIFRPRSAEILASFDVSRDASPAQAAALAAVLLLGVVPMVLGAAWTGLDFRRVKTLLTVFLLICLSVALSYVAIIDQKGLIYLALLFFVFGYLLVGASANLDPEDFLKGLGEGTVLSQTVMMSVVLIDHDVHWGRLFGRNSPNYWGMAAQATIIGCLTMRNRPIQVLAIAISVVTMVWSQSRGSMLAVSAGLAVALGVLLLTKKVSAWFWIYAPAALAILGIFGLGYVSDKIFLVSNPARGLGSGFTGRVGAWTETLDLFTSHPIFGVGYREHEHYLTSAVSAHNAYLATLADVGMFGALAYLLFLFGGLALAAIKALGNPSGGRLMAVAYLSAYAANGLFERNALNAGDFYSMLAIVICAWSWRKDDYRPASPSMAFRGGPP